MKPNNSPWIKQLNRTRPAIAIEKDRNTDILVVGGGIAGVVTAYYLLKETNKKIILLEADKIAHGATGHNAGQTTTYFERPLHDIAKEFGSKMAAEGQASVESGWDLLDQIYSDAGLKTPLYRFSGYAGCVNLEQILVHLENNLIRVNNGINKENIFVASESQLDKKIDHKYKDLYTVIPHKDLLELLETKNKKFTSCISYQKGCMNSAAFTEELLGYLSSNFSNRFSFFENSPVKSVILEERTGYANVLDVKVNFDNVILCTNGFENFTIENKTGINIDTKFHHLVSGRIGYMEGFIEESAAMPTAISYFQEKHVDDDPTGDSYYYLTRRPDNQGDTIRNLLCVGGPDQPLPNGATYSREDTVKESVQMEIEDFLEDNYKNYDEQKIKSEFHWHGLMGYTPNLIRRIGVEPCNPVLLYNLGCNGVGILPAVFGGKRISQIINNEKLEKSIFDPVDQSCQIDVI
jgi:glycine/D-amino acid oxidase-like deaminating enzyme